MKIFKGSLARQSPIAHGVSISTSLVGQAISLWYGHVRIPVKTIWIGNFISSKKSGGLSGAASGGSGGGIQSQIEYYCNFSTIAGYGPFQGIGQVFLNGGQYGAFPTGIQTFTAVGPGTSFSFTISNNPAVVMCVRGVTLTQSYSVTYNDYGNPQGSQSFSGSTELPIHNGATFSDSGRTIKHFAPNNGLWENSGQPWAEYNRTFPTDNTVVVHFPSPVSNITVNVYYNYAIRNGGPDETALQFGNLGFERELGSSASGEPLVYKEFSGIAAASYDLGPVNALPNFNFEAYALYGYSKNGDCNPADIIADLICSGNSVLLGGGVSAAVQWSHGANLNNFVSGSVGGVNPCYSRYGGILKDEPNIYSGGGSSQGLTALRTYCQARGIFISGGLDSQQPLASVLTDLAEISNAAPVFDGVSLDFIPYDEESFYGNGASYISPTASGPLFSFIRNDFLSSGKNSDAPVTLVRTTENRYNSLTIQYKDRTPVSGELAETYATNTLTLTDPTDVNQRGPIPGPSKNYDWITGPDVASTVGTTLLNRSIIVQNRKIRFKLPASWFLLTPMDLITVSDDAIFCPSSDPTFSNPVMHYDFRITSVEEAKDFTLNFEAEPFIYGASTPTVQSAQAAGGSGGIPPPNVDPGSVNTPNIFESTPKLSSVPQLIFGVSGSTLYNGSLAYGGCNAWMSTDGGNTYLPIGQILGNNTMGLVYSSNYPSAADPDNTNTLHVDLTESLGTLSAFTSSQQNMFLSLCYITPGGTVTVNGQTLTIPYELIAYQGATLAATNKYSLTPPIRRTVYGTPQSAHNIGQAFQFLGDSNILKINLPSSLIGVTLYFKFTAFNIFGSNEQTLATATAYTFTPTGALGFNQGDYTVTPIPTVFQGKTGGWPVGTGGDANANTWTDPTKVYTPQSVAHFSIGDATYFARDSGLAVFTNTAGGQQAWITVYDPTQNGESGGTSLTMFAELTSTKWNTPGYTRIGTLVSTNYSTGTGGGSGGGGGTGGPGIYSINYFEGDKIQPESSQTLLRLLIPGDVTNITLPKNLVGSYGGCITAPTSTFTVTIKQNGTTIGTMTIASGTTSATFSFSADVIAVPGDKIDFVAQSGVDATIAGISFVIAASRS